MQFPIYSLSDYEQRLFSNYGTHQASLCSPLYVVAMYVDLGFNLFPGGSDGKVVCLQCGRPRFNPWVRKIPWRRKWQPTPVLLPGKFHGWRNLIQWNCKELDTTEQLDFTMPQFSYHLLYDAGRTILYLYSQTFLKIKIIVVLIS